MSPAWINLRRPTKSKKPSITRANTCVVYWGRQVNLRNTPGLLFKYDHSIRQSMEMSMLIDSLSKKK